MTVDAELVRRWEVVACQTGMRRLFGIAEDLDLAYERLCRVESGLDDWRGPAAAQAGPRVRRAVVAVSRLAGLLRQAADSIRSGLAGLAEVVRLSGAAAQSPAAAAETIAAAVAVDGRIAAGLSAVSAGLGGRPVDPPESVRLPTADRTPAQVAAWWTALPPHLRRLAVTEQATDLGRLAGLPAEVRDAANRLVLARLLRSLRAERDRLVAAELPLLPADLRWVADGVRTRLAIVESAERELAALALTGRPARLLTLDLEGAGRVAIGLGDVDRARHVAVVVPGMGQDAVRGVGRTVGQAARLLRQAGCESGASTAVVAWTGYAAPGWAQVPFTGRAFAGGRSLAEDVHALVAGRTADGGDPPHLTVVGHSYGSTVVGAAATTQSLPADDLVLLGSPGVLADDVRGLGRGRDHVFVGEATFDPVADLGAFGADPGAPEFGATRIRADPAPGSGWEDRLSGGDHSRYFDAGSESLRNVARVVVGRGADTTRVDVEGER